MGSSTSAQRYATLTVEALADALRGLPGWALEQGHLVRRVAVRDPWRVLERVSQVELELDHHSVVALDRGQLVFSVWTHVRPGLTSVDVELAHRIDEVTDDPASGDQPAEG